MKDKITVSETLRRVLLLKETLNELLELKKAAFIVFDDYFFPLSKMEEVCDTFWEELCSWSEDHEDIGIPHLHMQDFRDIKNKFNALLRAHINRKEFSAALEPSRDAVEECIKQIQTELAKEEKKLNELYDEFVQSTGDFKFIFEQLPVKQLIMDKFLKL